jgi:hypothetical protein
MKKLLTLLLLIPLLLTSCALKLNHESEGEAIFWTLMAPGWTGHTVYQHQDRNRYLPNDVERDRVYYGCLNETAGKGREPFDTCMLAKGYTR